MNRCIKLGLSLVCALSLSACAAAPASSPSPVPTSFVLGEDTLLSLNTAVSLGDNYQFKEIADASSQTVSYVYTQLEDGSLVAQAYARALVQDWDCQIQPEDSVDFSHTYGQVKLIQHMEGSGRQLYITIQWDQTSCTVTLSLSELGEDAAATPEPAASESPAVTPGADPSAAPTAQPDSAGETPTTSAPAASATPSGPITLEEAIRYLEGLSPSFLQLPGDSMDEFIVLCQEGTVYLESTPCLLLNIYQALDHKYQNSYLLDVSTFQVYQLDRISGEATALH